MEIMNIGMDASEKKTIKNRIRIVSALVISVFLLVFYFILCFSSLSLINKSTELQYETDCRNLAHAYSYGITQLISGYLSDLKVFSEADIFKYGTEQQIISWVRSHDERRPDNFLLMYYADMKGDLYASTGQTASISDRMYFKKIMEGEETAVDDGSVSRTTGMQVIHFARAVYNADHRRIGLIGGAVELTTLQKIISTIKIGKAGYAFIINSSGQFLSYPDETQLFRRNETYSQDSPVSNVVYMLQNRRGYFKAVTGKGLPVTIAFEPVAGTSWLLGISIPESQVKELADAVSRNQVSVLLMIILGIIIFIAAEALVMHFLDRYFTNRAVIDRLTGLWTGQKFEKEAQAVLTEDPSAQFMFIDADIRGFKMLNQAYGQEKTDKMLVLLGTALRDSSSKYGGITGHGYADRFYALFKVSNTRNGLKKFKEELLPINRIIRQSDIPFYTKFGVSFSKPGTEPSRVQDLDGKASFAKSTISENILYQYSVFSQEMQRKIQEEQEIESSMEKALARGEFFVMYQPKISLATGKIAGAEALVRWNHPKYGILSPGKFIPVFEKNGFVVRLDFYVYEKVFQFLRRQLDSGKTVVPVSVNMSRSHLNPENFIQEFTHLFTRYSLPPSLIEVEILERTSETGKLILLETTNLLHKNGFTVAMDDFGSGESSLNMLSSIPVDVLKFDQTFLRKEEQTSKTQGMITTLVELGKQLEKETVFEGVETEEQMNFLKSIHCDEVQGFFYSRPLSEEDFVQFISEHI
jgi:EAL domain-containing protein (putative c-di-GMP-specific phosphodiesterase class I)/GGDEF domain-containing protein